MSSSSPVSLDDIVALFAKVMRSFEKDNFTRTTERLARAAAQAEQLTWSKDNLISAYLKTYCWVPAINLAQFYSPEDRAASIEAAHAELRTAFVSLQRRRTAGTLLHATELEMSFYNACMSSDLPSTQLLSGAEALPGFATFMFSATSALLCAVGAATSFAESQVFFDFVADALDLIGQTVAPDGSPQLFVGPAEAVVKAFPTESILVRDISLFESVLHRVRGRHPEALRRFDEAWQRLSVSTVFRVRNFADGLPDDSITEERVTASPADDLQRRVLRHCQLPACGKAEVHPSQFKHCSGCSAAAIVYCCKEHQVADWPSHKAACKAARKGMVGEKKKEAGAGTKERGGAGGNGGGDGGSAAAGGGT